jgi:hypothetical protein
MLTSFEMQYLYTHLQAGPSTCFELPTFHFLFFHQRGLASRPQLSKTQTEAQGESSRLAGASEDQQPLTLPSEVNNGKSMVWRCRRMRTMPSRYTWSLLKQPVKGVEDVSPYLEPHLCPP